MPAREALARQPAASDAPAPDSAASAFQAKCAACHTVGGGKFGDAPDLNVVSAWPRADLLAAIKRMEKNVGPLTDEEIGALAGLLQASDVRQRLAGEQQRIMARLRASVPPGNPAAGRALFRGDRRLAGGALPCTSCHTAEAQGGSFAVDLTAVFGRLGETALVSAIQGANFPVMQAAYRDRPVTLQEAVDLAAYFKSINPAAPTPAPPTDRAPIGAAGAVLAVLLAVGLAAHGRRPAAGTRARLVGRATRSRES